MSEVLSSLIILICGIFIGVIVAGPITYNMLKKIIYTLCLSWMCVAKYEKNLGNPDEKDREIG